MTSAHPEHVKHGPAGPGEVRRERHLLLRTEAYLEARSASYVVAAGLALVALIGAVDVATGPLVSPSLFYLIPVGLVTWRLGRGWGTFVAVASALVWLAGDLLTDAYGAQSAVPYWNVAVRFGVLFVVASLLATLKEALQRHRDLAAEEGKAAEGLRELNALKDTLLHAISHDLRGPITAILGSVQTLERGDQLQLTPEQRANLLNAISVSGRKLNRMVTDLLDLERVDRGVVEPQREPTEIGALARKLVEEADFLAEHPVRIAAEPVVVSVDAGKVERILENLLANAAKHTPVGTPVLLKVRSLDGGVLVNVDDEGPGIPDEVKTTIFEPFRQGPEARSKGSGAGIGLSLVKKFAELHGGRAWVEDRPGGGTSFGVFLPDHVVETPAAPTARAPRAAVH
ncbi:MAG: PAS domain-containing sensor histidine kinase [Actinobacteria bacterium]|nr:PAS domain-containing sensor histidine kinase [Actinomycetota bacterium]